MIGNFSLLVLILINMAKHVSDNQTINPLEEYQWKNRLIIINSSSKLAQEQMQLFQKYKIELSERDVLLVQVIDTTVYIDSRQAVRMDASEIRKNLTIGNHFECILIGKDGDVKQRSNILQPPTYFFDLIDQMPMRRNEVKN